MDVGELQPTKQFILEVAGIFFAFALLQKRSGLIMKPQLLPDPGPRKQFQPNTDSESEMTVNTTTKSSLTLAEKVKVDSARKIEECAIELLESHPHFRGRIRLLKCRCSNGCLVLSGKLPSFYLKQLAQEALRVLDGVILIENQIFVASPIGEMEQQPIGLSFTQQESSGILKCRHGRLD